MNIKRLFFCGILFIICIIFLQYINSIKIIEEYHGGGRGGRGGRGGFDRRSFGTVAALNTNQLYLYDDVDSDNDNYKIKNYL